ncbi:MAG: DNA cytosine methyltransferase [Deltaproteobacteria bacterium]|nr:DNA cytosine methyltransferase [Deltaproteobacteria bacterium]
MKNRKLSWRELAAFQTFPADFGINSSRVESQRQIGDAGPS